jgi:chromosome segregation and condensation protein ScpB
MKQFFAIFVLLSTFAWAQSEPVDITYTTVQGVRINLVTVDLNSSAIEIRPILAPPGEAISFQGLLNQGEGPYTAITGTFFDPATAITVGNVVHNGRLMTEGSVGSVMTIGEDNKARVRSLEGKMGRHIDWTGTKFAVSAGPTLLTDGQITIAPGSEGFRDPGLYGARVRAAMGVTAENKLLLLTSREPVSLHGLARIFQDLGAVDAVNLDGGSSTALYYGGSTVTRPYRRLTNLIGIYAAGTAPDQSRALSTQYAQAYKHYLKGVNLFNSGGSLRLAHSQVRKALSMAPDRPPYWETLGQILEMDSRLEEAAQSFLKAAELYAERSQDDKALQCAASGFRLVPELRGQYPAFASLLSFSESGNDTKTPESRTSVR